VSSKFAVTEPSRKVQGESERRAPTRPQAATAWVWCSWIIWFLKASQRSRRAP